MKKSPILLTIAVILALATLYIKYYPTKSLTSIVSLHAIEETSIMAYDRQHPTYATLTSAEQVLFNQLTAELSVQKKLVKTTDVNRQYEITMKRPTSAYDEQLTIINDDTLLYYPVEYNDNMAKRSTKPRYYSIKNGEALMAFLQSLETK